MLKDGWSLSTNAIGFIFSSIKMFLWFQINLSKVMPLVFLIWLNCEWLRLKICSIKKVLKLLNKVQGKL